MNPTPKVSKAAILNPVFLVIGLLALGLPPLAAAPALKPWSTNSHPSDLPKSYIEEITAGRQQYTILQSGAMDGRNCRSPMGCGINR